MKKIIICLLITILLIFSACKAKPEVVETEEVTTPTEETIDTVEEEIIQKGIYVSNNLPGKTFSLKIPEDWSMHEYTEKNIVQFSPPIEEMKKNDAIYTIFVGVFEEFPPTDFSNIKFPDLLKNIWSSIEGEEYQTSKLGNYEAKEYIRSYEHLMSIKEDNGESSNETDKKRTALEGGIIAEQEQYKYLVGYYYVGDNSQEFENLVKQVANSFGFSMEGESKIDQTAISEKSLNILLIGRDARPNERNTWCRSDINIILHINLNDGSTALISIPRDTRV